MQAMNITNAYDTAKLEKLSLVIVYFGFMVGKHSQAGRGQTEPALSRVLLAVFAKKWIRRYSLLVSLPVDLATLL